MDYPNEKPLYALTVSEFAALTRQLVLDILKEQENNLQQASSQEEENPHFTIRELTKYLRCSRMSIYNYKKLGLPFYRLGRKVLFKKTEVMDFMRRVLGRDLPKKY